jgi:hypothetical protein
MLSKQLVTNIVSYTRTSKNHIGVAFVRNLLKYLEIKSLRED